LKNAIDCIKKSNSYNGGMRLKIVQVSGRNPFIGEPSGTLTYISNLLRSFQKKGFEVSLICIQDDEYDKKSHNYDIIPIKMKKITSYTFLLKLLIKAPTLKLSKDSIIHTHRPDFMLPFILFFRKNPKICTLHGIPNVGIRTRKHKIVWWIYDVIERFSLNRVDRLVAVDQRTKEYYEKRQPALKDKITMIPVGIDTDVFKPMDKEKMRKKYGFHQEERIILYIGRFSIEKGLDLLLKAFNKVDFKIPNCRLVLVGKGSETNKLKDIIGAQKINNITFMDPVLHEKIPEIMNCADVFTLTSSYEGMPTVVLEALACGVPVVATDVGDVKKVVLNDKTGHLIKDRQIEKIEGGILMVLRDEREGVCRDCVAVAVKYSWENISEYIIKEYHDLLKV
jgi:glycosyltransferase involved in cell wall biosynthesis